MVALVPHLEKIYSWWSAGKTDQWIAEQLSSTPVSVKNFRIRRGMADMFRDRKDDFNETEAQWMILMRGRLFDIRATSDNGPAHLPRIDPARGMGASPMALLGQGWGTGHAIQSRGTDQGATRFRLRGHL